MRSTAEHLARTLVQSDVGTTKSIDRLLRIADNEDTAGRNSEVGPRARCRVSVVRGTRGDEHGEFDLNGIGVLELVEEKPGIALVQGSSRGSAGAQQAAGQHKQVVELELALIASRVRCAQCEIAQHDEPLREHVINCSLAHRLGLLFNLGARVAHRGDIDPRALLADPAAIPFAPLADEPEELIIVVFRIGGPKRVQFGRDGQEMAEQRVFGIVAVVNKPQGTVDRAVQRGTVERHRRGWRGKHEVFETIPIRIEHRCYVFERDPMLGMQRNADTPKTDDECLVGGVGLPHRDRVVPALLEREGGLHVVKHRHARGDGNLDRMLRQDALREGVHRGDRSAVDVGQRFEAAQSDHGVVTRGAVLERATNAIA